MAAPINILFITASLDFGGAEKHLVSLINQLDPARYRLSLAYLKPPSPLLSQIDPARLERRVLCCDVRHKVDPRAAGLLARHIRAERVDIVVCANPYALLYGWLARIAAGKAVRLVEVFHSTELATRKERLHMLLYRPLFWASDALVYVCHNQRRYWHARGLRARLVQVIHNGIDPAHFDDRWSAAEKNAVRQAYGFPHDAYLVGLCAYMRPEKAHGDLLRAVAALVAAGLDVKCLLIGDGPQRPPIEAQIAALGLQPHVRITGFRDDVRQLIASCDVMAIVSHHVETFSLAALEAMALGKPMVMSAIGGAAEQVAHGENGLLFERGHIAALTAALRSLMGSVARHRMGGQARRTVLRQFSLATMTDAYAALFERLAARRG